MASMTPVHEKTSSDDVEIKSSHSEFTDTNIFRPEVDVSQVDEKRLMRKIDFRLIPWLALLYLMNFLDRGSIGNARVRMPEPTTVESVHSWFTYRQLYGMEADLGLTDKHYLIALTVFFFPYSLFEVGALSSGWPWLHGDGV